MGTAGLKGLEWLWIDEEFEVGKSQLLLTTHLLLPHHAGPVCLPSSLHSHGWSVLEGHTLTRLLNLLQTQDRKPHWYSGSPHSEGLTFSSHSCLPHWAIRLPSSNEAVSHLLGEALGEHPAPPLCPEALPAQLLTFSTTGAKPGYHQVPRTPTSECSQSRTLPGVKLVLSQ